MSGSHRGDSPLRGSTPQKEAETNAPGTGAKKQAADKEPGLAEKLRSRVFGSNSKHPEQSEKREESMKERTSSEVKPGTEKPRGNLNVRTDNHSGRGDQRRDPKKEQAPTEARHDTGNPKGSSFGSTRKHSETSGQRGHDTHRPKGRVPGSSTNHPDRSDQRRDSGNGRASKEPEHELEPAPLDAEEALCAKCRDAIIYVDPNTGEPYERKYGPKPEFCPDCGRRTDKNPSKRNDLICEPCSMDRGKRRALLIGVNYKGQPGVELAGCQNDVKRMSGFLQKNGYNEEDITILMEDWSKYRHPTRDEIKKSIGKLFEGAEVDDRLFIHYSGHGNNTKDYEGDEVDGKDEGIYPVDYRVSEPRGMLKDDELYKLLADVPEGVHVTALFDSCHSGSVLDLPYTLQAEAQKNLWKSKKNSSAHDNIIKGDIFLWSGCTDQQNSKEARNGNKKVGIMSEAFVKAYDDLDREKKRITYRNLYTKIEQLVGKKSGNTQKPQLSSNLRFDVSNRMEEDVVL